MVAILPVIIALGGLAVFSYVTSDRRRGRRASRRRRFPTLAELTERNEARILRYLAQHPPQTFTFTVNSTMGADEGGTGNVGNVYEGSAVNDLQDEGAKTDDPGSNGGTEGGDV